MPEHAEIRDRADRLVEALSAAEKTLATAESCTGGWIAKALTELHGGRLDISSRPGEGTTVTVDLPPERCLNEEAEAGGATG